MSRLRAGFGRLFRPATRSRTRGRPPSGNGASSFHLWWDTFERCASISATLEVLEPPTVNRLYFFALQASFWSDRHEGGAHTGLQWNGRHPGSTAINWGGYGAGGGILAGSDSPLASAPNDPNTRDFRWVAGGRYRFTIGPRSAAGLWPARVEGLDTGEDVVIRELVCQGDHLRSPVVWSEVFADCDHPSVAVRWSDLAARTVSGSLLEIHAGRVSYQSHAAGGCANTTVLADGRGVLQRSSSERDIPDNTTLVWNEA